MNRKNGHTWFTTTRGEVCTKVPVIFPLDETDLAALLASALQITEEDPAKLTAAQIEKRVHDELYGHGLLTRDDGDSMVTNAHRLAIQRAFGGPEPKLANEKEDGK